MATLLLLAFMQGAAGFALPADIQSSWMIHGTQLPLDRHVRELPPVDTLNVTDLISEDCQDVMACHYTADRQRLLSKLGDFTLGDIPALLNEDLCQSASVNCWNDECNNRGIQVGVEIENAIIDRLCKVKDGLTKASACFQAPFPETMSACARSSFGPSIANLSLAARTFRICLTAGLFRLPMCTAEDKTLFLSLFEFVFEENLKRATGMQ